MIVSSRCMVLVYNAANDWSAHLNPKAPRWVYNTTPRHIGQQTTRRPFSRPQLLVHHPTPPSTRF
eukprot:40550-Eustigmatos_ZCMA.PRE.1